MMQSDPPADAYDGKRGVLVHDQGDMLRLNDKYSAQLAQLVYKNGTRVLKLGIVDNATGKTVAYTWANPEAERIGINLRWVQVGFTRNK